VARALQNSVQFSICKGVIGCSVRNRTSLIVLLGLCLFLFHEVVVAVQELLVNWVSLKS
jgi:hypothetical protein